MKSSENHGSMKISGRIEVCLILDPPRDCLYILLLILSKLCKLISMTYEPIRKPCLNRSELIHFEIRLISESKILWRNTEFFEPWYFNVQILNGTPFSRGRNNIFATWLVLIFPNFKLCLVILWTKNRKFSSFWIFKLIF